MNMQAKQQIKAIRALLDGLEQLFDGGDSQVEQKPPKQTGPTSPIEGEYNIRAIRDLLLNGFGESELRYLILYEPSFAELKHQVATLNNPSTLIDIITTFADQKVLMGHLLRWCKNNTSQERYGQDSDYLY
jgi:hypothetical protein